MREASLPQVNTLWRYRRAGTIHKVVYATPSMVWYHNVDNKRFEQEQQALDSFLARFEEIAQ